MQILINILFVIEIIVCLLIVLVVLMQRPKNEGLGAAFGGGVTENMFGAQTTNVLQKFTRVLAVAFFVLTAALSWLQVKASTIKSEAQRQINATAPLPAAIPTPAPAASPAPVEVEQGKAPTPQGPSAVSQPVKVSSSPAPSASPAPAPGATPAPAATPSPASTPAPATPKPGE